MTILIAHVMFTLGYVVVTVRARLEGMDLHIEEAAQDLANQWTTLRKVTLPMIMPGIAVAGLLAFAISIDDFVVTNFNAGQTITFLLFVYGAVRQGVPPQVNVIATMLLLVVLILMFVNLTWQRLPRLVARRAHRARRPPGRLRIDPATRPRRPRPARRNRPFAAPSVELRAVRSRSGRGRSMRAEHGVPRRPCRRSARARHDGERARRHSPTPRAGTSRTSRPGPWTASAAG